MTSEPALVQRWRTLLTSYNEVAGHLERALQEAHGLTMGEFETLDRLITIPCEKRRMQDLAADMYLSQSALSRTVARLEYAKHGGRAPSANVTLAARAPPPSCGWVPSPVGGGPAVGGAAGARPPSRGWVRSASRGELGWFGQ